MSDEQLWKDLWAADVRYIEARMALMQRAEDLDRILGALYRNLLNAAPHFA
jgi:hypothetical protein